ncbi:MAG: DNA polymerase III subunit gamma/tau, partial [Fidelibacterota bacterium]
SRNKIYIIDEVHMLTREAFNALLKTLEEPPKNVLFIFATTEPYKIPPTILSRCQRFDFKRITVKDIEKRLKEICKKENIEIDNESLITISRKADGSLRDAQSILDQAISFSGQKIKYKDLVEILGLIPQDLFFSFIESIYKKELEKALQLIDYVISEGYNLDEFLNGVIDHLRNLLILKVSHHADFTGIPQQEKERYLNQLDYFSDRDILRYLKMLSEAYNQLRYSTQPRVLAEITAYKMISMDKSVKIESILQRLDSLKKSFSGIEIPAPESKKEREIDLFKTGTAELEAEEMEADIRAPLPDEDSPSEPQEPPIEEKKLDLETIKSAWDEIVKRVKQTNPALGQFLSEGIPIAIEGRVLKIGFTEDNGFHMGSIMKRRESVEEAIKEIIGTNLRIQCKKMDKPKKDKLVKKDISKDPIARKIMDLFDAEDLGDKN